MELFKIFSISGAGMAVQRSRMSVVTANLANTETTRTPEGGPYRRRNVIFQAVPLEREFPDSEIADVTAPLNSLMSVEIVSVKQSNRPPRKIFDPNHADANPDGYVALPDINIMEEMVDLLSAVRSYEANLAAYNTTKSLIRRLLEIGRAP